MEPEVQASAEQISKLVGAADIEGALSLLATLHPADQADILADLTPEDRAPLLAQFPAENLAKLLGYLTEEPRRHVVEELDPAALGPLLDQVDSDVATDILKDLPAETARRVLATMATAGEVSSLLPHADTTAGGRMTTDLVAVHSQWTAEQCLNYLRQARPEAEQAYYLYVVDNNHRLRGVLSLRHLVVAPPEALVAEIMTPEVISVSEDTDQEEVARLVRHYDFAALPVIDADEHLVGVISGDDVLDVVTEEATEDMYRMVGLPAEEVASAAHEVAAAPVARAVRRRLPWLLVNLMTAFLAALTVSAFEDTISKVAALAIFMPVIAGQAGNTGSQTATIMVRGLALGEVEPRDVWAILSRQLPFGLVAGFAVGLPTAALALLLTGNGWLGLVVTAAMVGNNIIAVGAGTLIPLTLRWLRLDPALSATIWLTTFTDVMGFVLLLGLGALLVNRLS